MFEYKLKAVTVIDGDTIDAVVDLGFNVSLHERFRLVGINAPEMSSASGISSKKQLERLCTQFPDGLSIQSEKPLKQEKYGRWLATVWGHTSGAALNLNLEMIRTGFAVEYDGKGKVA